MNEWAVLGLVILAATIGFWFGYLAGGTRVQPRRGNCDNCQNRHTE